MARLIDADVNREEFKKILCCTLNDCSITTKKKFNLIMTAFDDMPTAYDVEKVVEELEGEKSKSIYDYDSVIDVKSAYSKAIDIVRKGGVK